MKKERNQTIMQLYVRVPYYTDTYYIFTTSSLLKLLYYEFLVKYHEIFRLLYFQNTKKKGGSVFIPFLWVTAYLTWPFCTFDAVSVRFVFNICQYLQYYITLNIILIYCQWSDLNREVKKNNLACIKCIIFWVTFLNLKQTTSSTATIC